MPKLTEAELDALEDQLRTDIRQAGCPEGLVDNALDLGLLLPLVDDALDVERAVRMVTGRGTPQDRRWLKRSGLSKAFKVLKGKP